MEGDIHDRLLSPATLMLGKMHLTLLRAKDLMDSRRWTWTKSKEGIGGSSESTDFGKEVGADEINWWVSKKETDIDELRSQTQRALKSAQVLKNTSATLKDKRPESYEDLLSTLRKFAEQHAEEIETLYKYVNWLDARDPMAPRILFTYRVWGSTKMADRSIDIGPDNAMTGEQMLRMSTEIVLGICDRTWRVRNKVTAELSLEAWESMDPEYVSPDIEIKIPESRIVARTTRRVYEECAIYFSEIRDSLRNILLDIDEFKAHQNLVHSDAFWREFILKAVRTKKTETQLWDFKQTLTMWHVKEQPEKDHAKVTFAEDVASFANARGGVLVVGVSDNREIVGLASSSRDLENRLKAARAVIHDHVEYDREIVLLQQVVVTVNGEEKVCLVVIVARAYEAVGVRDGKGGFTYPVRQENGIQRVSPRDLWDRWHAKSDKYDFMSELEQFVRDN